MQGGAAAKAHKVKVDAHASELATMALDRVRTKLLSNTSVEYTVNELIRAATDVNSLATIFHGTSGLNSLKLGLLNIFCRMAALDVGYERFDGVR